MKRFILNVVTVICYYFGVCSLFYFLNRRAKRIITFHNVLPDDLFREGLANGVSCNFSSFMKIIAECRKRFNISNDLLDASTLTLTFDDGYLNQYSTAFKTMKKLGIPAYVFVSDMGEEELLIDKLLHWVSEAPIDLIPNGDRIKYWVEEIWPRFVADSERMGQTVFDELDGIYPYAKIRASLPPVYCCERLTRIPTENLNEMRMAGWSIGWHTVNHYPLSKLDDARLSVELDSPMEFRNVCFSYPYGNPGEVGEKAVDVVRKMLYPYAVSNTNKSDWNTTRFFLPRMSLSSNKYRLHFVLSGVEHFIKHKRLLPRIK